MIVTAILKVVVAVVSVFDAFLPHLTVPSWFLSAALTSTVATDVGDVLGIVKPVFPVDIFMNVLEYVFATWPIVIGYFVFEWVLRHLPTIAGFSAGHG